MCLMRFMKNGRTDRHCGEYSQGAGGASEWSVTEVAKKTEEISQGALMCFAPDNLNFLWAGGRMSNATALVGNLLQIHPLIEVGFRSQNVTAVHSGS